MNSAGKRRTQPPNRYNPSEFYPSPQLPSTDFDLTMSTSGDNDPPSLAVLEQRIIDMTESFNIRLENVTKKFAEIDQRIEELCTRIDENDTDLNTKIIQLRTSVNQDFVQIHNDISGHQHTVQESQKSNTGIQRTTNDTISHLSDRVCLVEGLAARVSALENQPKKTFHFRSPL